MNNENFPQAFSVATGNESRISDDSDLTLWESQVQNMI